MKFTVQKLPVFALAGGLAIMQLAGQSASAAIMSAPSCNVGTPVIGPQGQSSLVNASVSLIQNGDQASGYNNIGANHTGKYLYQFRVCNTAPEFESSLSIRDWEIAWFGAADMGVDLNTLRLPEGWGGEIESKGTTNEGTGWEGVIQWQQAGDPFKIFFDNFYGANNPFNDHDDVLHFFTGEFVETDGILEYSASGDEIDPGREQDGFSFISIYDSNNAPYQTSWVTVPVNTGDPQNPTPPAGAFPNSPTIFQPTAVWKSVV